MKYAKQILEAVQRGIKLALDDFEDDEVQNQESILSKKKIQNYDPKDDFDIYNNFVDLGLPSGTLWAKYNLGCNFDLLNNHLENTKHKDWYGNYYAWGELKIKDNYSQKTYKFGNDQFSKYNNKDKLTQLQLEDDVATLILGNGFHIPTKEQFEELFEYTNQNIETNYKRIWDLHGVTFKSIKNDNIIFFPATGIKTNNNWNNAGTLSCYWTNSIYMNNENNYKNAWHFYSIYNTQINYDSGFSWENRYNGITIRPVFNR